MQRDLNFTHDDRQVVLYVEDHPTNVHLMQAIFKRLPQLSLVVAVDGASALRIAETLRPCLLLLDLRLPDCHGRELLAELRGREGYAEIPAVAVTAEPAFDVEGTSFLEVWPKPIDLNFVLERLDSLAPVHAAYAGAQGLARPHRSAVLHPVE
jgi:CheY-like chemotaxis protein